ncbi:MAG TPA: hypothetical protein VGC60_13125 [Pyrinomonadaceae bacterium]
MSVTLIEKPGTDQAARERDEFLKELAEIRTKGSAAKRNEN